MILINQYWSLEHPRQGIEEAFAGLLELVERAGRTCYKSEDKIENGSSEKFVQGIIDKGHHSVIEHANMSVRIVSNRGVTHELVRHRLASYSQESTRYANYSQERFGNEITVIKPVYFEEGTLKYKIWHEAMLAAERAYMMLIENGAKAQEARGVLPIDLKTEVVMTANLREWRHVFNLRCSPKAHPQIRALCLDMLSYFGVLAPVFFGDLRDKYVGEVV